MRPLATEGGTLRPIADVLVNFAEDRQASWEHFVARAGLASTMPRSFAEVIARVIAFADPVLSGTAPIGTWIPGAATWHAAPPRHRDGRARLHRAASRRRRRAEHK
ncbi:MAG: hypothetical protein ACT4QF_18580 [Sporichthyaceae bacterium]